VTFAFAGHELDLRRQELRRGGEVVHIEPQVFDLLAFLLKNRDRIVSKDEILDEVWHGRIVSEAALSSRINAARKAIGDSGSDQIFIKTFHRRGFRFVFDAIERADDHATPLPAGTRANRGGPPIPEQAVHEPTVEHAPERGRPSIAVMPFVNLSRDPEHEYFAYGLTEDVIRLLSRNRWLTVLSRHTGRNAVTPDMDARAIGVALGVRYLVQGSVRKTGEHVHITAELVKTEDGSQLWSDAFDLDLADVFEIQEAMAKQIAAVIEPEVGSAEREAAVRKPPGNLDAWDCYQRGFWHLWGFTTPGFDEAEAMFRRAIGLEPELARAHAGLSYVHLQKAFYGEPDERPALLQAALAQAKAAVRLDERDCICHCVLGRALTLLCRYDEAIAALEHAIELNPSFAQGYFALGFAMLWAGREEEAIALIERAVELSPRDPHLWTFYQVRALAHFALGELKSAAFFARKAIRQPNATDFPHALLVATLGLLDDIPAAGEAVPELMQKKPSYTRAYAKKDFFYCSDAALVERYLEGLRRAGVPA
jgi:TolB-like protein/DNA-binding winged helix-turn-helix (wHTH) protein